MNLDIQVENNKVSCKLEGKNYSSSFENLTPIAAVKALEQMINDAKYAATTTSDQIREILRSNFFTSGAIAHIPVAKDDLAKYRCLLANVCKDEGVKVKTKAFVDDSGEEMIEILCLNKLPRLTIYK